ncbi:MAG: CDP-diacylglycerol--glycerol-3-phosphate 3-phosphatidyltransferase [Verrucomicrobiales bacterium]
MNLPNKLTVARLVLSFVFAALLSIEGLSWGGSAALIVFSIAAYTDLLDGQIARKRNLITNFGKLMDPLADKVLMCAGFVMLCEQGFFPAWIVVVILAREFLVTGLRLVASAEGIVLAAENLGKYKTTFQIIAVIYFLLVIASREAAFAWISPVLEFRGLGPHVLGQLLIWIALILTVVSGLSYLWKNRKLLADC